MRPDSRSSATQDVTENAAEVAPRWHDARARHREALVAREGEANFQGLQRFLDCVRTLSVERRLSRYAYLAEKPDAGATNPLEPMRRGVGGPRRAGD